MNETERLILENQMVIMNSLSNLDCSQVDKDNLLERFVETGKALAPQSDDLGLEEDVEEKGGIPA